MSLHVEDVYCHYGQTAAVRGLTLAALRGEVLCILGRNGAGKTTTLKSIMGLKSTSSGRILLGERDVTQMPAHRRAKLGIAYVPQGGRVFPGLTVEENLRMGPLAQEVTESYRARALETFPLLRDKTSRRAGSLSGGERQALSLAMTLSTNPKVVLLDEPSEGLMPSMVSRLVDIIEELKQEAAVVLAEQNLDLALNVADRVLVMDNGREAFQGGRDEVDSNLDVLTRHLGISRLAQPGDTSEE